MIEYITSLAFAGKVSVILSIIAVLYAAPNLRTYWRVLRNKKLDKDTRIHTFKLMVLICGIVGFCLSVFLYSSSLLAFDGAQPFRVELKWFQNASIFGIIIGLHGLKRYFIDRL